MKNGSKAIRKYIALIAAFIILQISGIAFFFISIQDKIVSNSKNNLMVNVSRQSIHLKQVFNIQYQYLEVIASQIANEDSLINTKTMDLLSSLTKNTDLELAALIESDGTAHYDNNVVKNISHRAYFKKAMDGENTLSDPIESSVDHKTRVVLAVPVVKNGTVIGVLGGSCNVTNLSHLLFDDLFDGQGYSLIMDMDGNIITCDNDDVFQQGDNIFSTYEANMTRVKQYILDDFHDGKDGFISLDITNNNQTDHYLAYTPLGMNDWIVGYVVPVSVAQSVYTFIEEYEALFVAIFTLLVLILILFILRINRKEKVELLHTAQTDALTGLFNKDYTQKAIDEYLSTNDTMNCFIIIDSDNFKRINDTYGHYAGDVVLSTLGKTYRESFRKNDIVGRIGGDEFVILMTDVPNTTIVEEKLNTLLQKVHEISLPEIQGDRLTISIGATMSPTNGNTFMKLYQNADKALYETKHVSKDGFTIHL